MALCMVLICRLAATVVLTRDTHACIIVLLLTSWHSKLSCWLGWKANSILAVQIAWSWVCANHRITTNSSATNKPLRSLSWYCDCVVQSRVQMRNLWQYFVLGKTRFREAFPRSSPCAGHAYLGNSKYHTLSRGHQYQRCYGTYVSLSLSLSLSLGMSMCLAMTSCIDHENCVCTVWKKIKQESTKRKWRPDDEEEFEDSEGRLLTKKTYMDLKRQGLL
jgi:hypothetical protein